MFHNPRWIRAFMELGFEPRFPRRDEDTFRVPTKRDIVQPWTKIKVGQKAMFL